MEESYMKPHEDWFFKAEHELMPPMWDVKKVISAAKEILSFTKTLID